MDPDPLRLLETAPPLRSSTLSANPANSRFSVREDRRLASSEAVNKIPQKTLTDQLRSLVLRRRPRKGRSFPARESLPNSILAHAHNLKGASWSTTSFRGRGRRQGPGRTLRYFLPAEAKNN